MMLLWFPWVTSQRLLTTTRFPVLIVYFAYLCIFLLERDKFLKFVVVCLVFSGFFSQMLFCCLLFFWRSKWFFFSLISACDELFLFFWSNKDHLCDQFLNLFTGFLLTTKLVLLLCDVVFISKVWLARLWWISYLLFSNLFAEKLVTCAFMVFSAVLTSILLFLWVNIVRDAWWWVLRWLRSIKNKVIDYHVPLLASLVIE